VSAAPPGLKPISGTHKAGAGEPVYKKPGLPPAEAIHFLRKQRAATAILPYSLRARVGVPVAAPVTWEELEEFESAAQFTIFETPLLLDRGTSEALRGWGEADQALPRIG
jgi:hypothetical protein